MGKKEVFSTDKALSVPERYSQVVKYGDIAFLSGQVAAEPKTGKPLGGTVGEQTKAILETMKAILQEMGLDLNAVLMMRCYLSDLSKMQEMNEVYEEYFQDVEIKPARCAVEAGMGEFDVEMYAVIGLE